MSLTWPFLLGPCDSGLAYHDLVLEECKWYIKHPASSMYRLECEQSCMYLARVCHLPSYAQAPSLGHLCAKKNKEIYNSP